MKLPRSRVLTTAIAAVIALLLAGFSVNFARTEAASALSGSAFDPSNIISDSVMFSGGAMSAGDVQALLNAKVPRCSLGDAGKPAGGYYAPHNVYLAQQCLKDFRESVPSLPGDSFCGPLTGGQISAAEMISRVGIACNVSPKVLLVLLEKEQSLVTDSWPNVRQYASATGFNCPDTAPCGAASAGFFKQLYSAARQLQVYGTGSYTWYPVGQTTQVRFHPNVACGSSPVRIQNRATAALYYYTPYQPNAAALGNLYGVGDACSAYGNRNFWRLYTDWFGSTLEVPGAKEFVLSAYEDVLGRAPESEAVLNYWAGRVSSGMSRADMSNAFNNSDEYRLLKINDAYSRALKRSADSGGSAYWLSVMRAGSVSPENLYATFLFMNEMYQVQGGGTNDGYISALYRELLNREADSAGLEYWSGNLSRGASLQSISDSIWYSPEKYNVRVQEAFQKFLGRSPSSAETSYWSRVAQTQGPTAMRTLLMSTDEYWNRANQRY